MRLASALVMLGCGMLAGCAYEATPPIPTAASECPTQRCPTEWLVVVQHGQSLDKLTRTLGVAKHAVIQRNELTPPYQIKTGSVLVVPANAAAPPQKSRRTAPKRKPAIIPLD